MTFPPKGPLAPERPGARAVEGHITACNHARAALDVTGRDTVGCLDARRWLGGVFFFWH